MNGKKYSTYFWIIAALILLLANCSKKTSSPVVNTPTGVFEQLWQDFDKQYSHFAIKNINWDSLHSVYAMRINDNLSDQELFNVLQSLLAELKDGHVRLTSPFSTYHYTGYYDRYPSNFIDLTTVAKRVQVYKNNNHVGYGITTENVGYIVIPQFTGAESDYQIIDQINTEFAAVKGIIIDVRTNGGGNSSFADEIASRYTTIRRTGSYVSYRNGPGHNDFGPLIASEFAQKGTVISDKNIIVLTSRFCYSSCEHFIFSMKSIPGVSIVGDTTGGGSGNPVTVQLVNGWTVAIPQWLEYDSKKVCYEGKGYPPDVYSIITPADSLNKYDRTLERAISMLK